MPLPRSKKTRAIITAIVGLIFVQGYGLTTFETSAVAKPITKIENQNLAFNFAKLLSTGQFTQAFKTMDSAMQSALPINLLTMTWQSLTAQLGPLKALKPESAENIAGCKKSIIAAEFERGTVDLQIVVRNSKSNANEKISGFLIKPHQAKTQEPTYAIKENFVEIPVKIGSGTYQLDGTLTLPKGQGPFPAVVLVHGSGPCDSDETIGAVKVFRDIAWGLASKEVAVLRYDKRTHQHGKTMMAAGVINNVTVKEETIDDALLAVALLANDKRIEKDHIYILGHSLGAMLIPRMAKADDTAAGFIVMAGPTRPLEDMILEQTQYLLSTGENGEKKAISSAGQKQLATLKEQIKVVKETNLSSATAAAKLPLGLPASYWLDLRDYKPAEAMKEIKKPILILQGGKDYQVTMVDFQNLWLALNEQGNTTFKIYNSLNHGFVQAGPVSTASDYNKPQNVAAEVITDISKWIKSQ